MTAVESSKSMKPLRELLNRLEDAANEAGDRISALLEDDQIKQRLSDASDAIDDLRLEVLRRVRGGPATQELSEMTVRELHELASEREISGRSSMNKAELIDALRKG